MPPVLAVTTENSNGYLFGFFLQALRRWIRSIGSNRSSNRSIRDSGRAVQVTGASSGDRQQQQQQPEAQQQQQQNTTEDWLLQADERQQQRVPQLLLDSGTALHTLQEDLWVAHEQQGAWSLPQ